MTFDSVRSACSSPHRGLQAAVTGAPHTFSLPSSLGGALRKVVYRAQMPRTWALLLRFAGREGYLLGGPAVPAQLQDGPFLLHPVDERTAGAYRDPVVCCDFSSLYPSVFQAHNMVRASLPPPLPLQPPYVRGPTPPLPQCYTTLVHPGDRDQWSGPELVTCPTSQAGGAAFVPRSVRTGVVPQILGLLLDARADAKRRLARAREEAGQHPPSRRRGEVAVLEARQKALKVCANALYGFTGAAASPLQCGPLAEACVHTGARTREAPAWRAAPLRLHAVCDPLGGQGRAYAGARRRSWSGCAPARGWCTRRRTRYLSSSPGAASRRRWRRAPRWPLR